MKNEDLVKLFLTGDLAQQTEKYYTNSRKTLSVKVRTDEVMQIYYYHILIGYRTPKAVYVINAKNTPFPPRVKDLQKLVIAKAKELVPEKLILTPFQRGETELPDTDLLVKRFEAQMEHLMIGTELLKNKDSFIEVYNSYKKFLNIHETTSKHVERYNTTRVNISDDKYMENLKQQSIDRSSNASTLIREGYALADSV